MCIKFHGANTIGKRESPTGFSKCNVQFLKALFLFPCITPFATIQKQRDLGEKIALRLAYSFTNLYQSIYTHMP